MAIAIDFGLTFPTLCHRYPYSGVGKGGELFLGCLSMADSAPSTTSVQRKFETNQASSEGGGAAAEQLQVCSWQHFFSDPTLWWDTRRGGEIPGYADFRHEKSADAHSSNNASKPACEDPQVAMLDTSLKSPAGAAVLPADSGDVEIGTCRTLCEGGALVEAVDALNLLVHRGCHVPNILFYRVLKRCKDLVLGRRIHALTLKGGYEGDAFLATHLIGLYASHGSLEEAMQVFSKVSTPDAYNWATIIFAYARHGKPAQAIGLYRQQMRESTIKPDNRVFVAVLKACASARDLAAGSDVHAQILASGTKPDMFVQTCLVDMYAKCGSLRDARRVFDKLSQKNVVTWTAMIAGYAQQGMGEEALSLYNRMQQEGVVPPNSVTYLCLLQACATVAALPLGKQLHAQIKERGLQAHVALGSCLVNMYAKCGSLEDAQTVFDSLTARNVVAWSALIAGYTRRGDSEVVFDLLNRMRLEGVQPDGITLLSVLTVCSHVGLVDQGRKYFEAMSSEYGISPGIEHYTCMMDLLGRAGHVEEALEMVKTVPFQANAAVWHTLLGACRKWSNVEVGRQAFELAMSVDQKCAPSYVLMSNIYAGAQMWKKARKMQARRVNSKAWKQPGQSWCTDMGGVVHTFAVGDRKHADKELEQPVGETKEKSSL